MRKREKTIVNELRGLTEELDYKNDLYEMLFDEIKNEFLKPDDRTIIWVCEKRGCTGKSKFVKWMCTTHFSLDVW